MRMMMPCFRNRKRVSVSRAMSRASGAAFRSETTDSLGQETGATAGLRTALSLHDAVRVCSETWDESSVHDRRTSDNASSRL